MKKLILVVPGLLLCGLSYFFQIEKTHYGFEHPGVDENSALLAVWFSVLAIVYALITLFFRHRDKLDFAISYFTLVFVSFRLIQIVFTALKYC